MEVSGHCHDPVALLSPLPSHGERTPVPIGLGGPQTGSGCFVVPAGDSGKRHSMYERGGSSFNHVAIGRRASRKDGCWRGQC